MNGRVLLAIAAILGVLLSGKQAAASVVAMVKRRGIPEGEAWTRFDKLFKEYGARYNVPWKWLKALALNESTLGTHPKVALGFREPLNKASISEDGLSWGLMQLRVKTAQDFEKDITYDKLNNPEIAVRVAAKFFAWIMKQFDKNDPKFTQNVVMSYNQGVAGTKKGYTGALPYWTKFQNSLVIVNERHPGE
jgi:soluble lytic murein transglycosylase-like protein